MVCRLSFLTRRAGCRVYAHVLLILDDNDFYHTQSVFLLPQQRAFATSFNALVFRTYCPAPGGKL